MSELENAAIALERAQSERRNVGYISMVGMSLEDREALAVRLARLDRQIVLLTRKLNDEINK